MNDKINQPFTMICTFCKAENTDGEEERKFHLLPLHFHGLDLCCCVETWTFFISVDTPDRHFSPLPQNPGFNNPEYVGGGAFENISV